MTPKEKAQDLVDKYLNASFAVIQEYIPVPLPFAKQCALIAVDEILWHIIKYSDFSKEYVIENSEYWQEVKQELNKSE